MNGFTTKIRKLTQNLNEIDETNKPYNKAITELKNIENVGKIINFFQYL